MKQDPLVSIIIPSYNGAAFIKEAVDSALAQTYSNIEIIVVDDGSTDNTKAVLAPYVTTHQIHYIYQPNAGLSAARNTGIRGAKGEYIALLDSDDIFLPRKIERQIAHFAALPDCDISYCGLYSFWDGEPEKLLKIDYQFYSGEDVLPNLVKKSFIAPLTMVIKKDVFGRFGLFDENFKRSEDLEFLVRVASAGANIYFLDEILAKLRLRRTGNLQSFKSQPEVKRTIVAIFEKLYQQSTPAERDRLQLLKYLRMHRLKLAFAYLENREKAKAKLCVKEAFKGPFPLSFTGFVVAAGISVVPAGLLAWLLRRYHLKVQASLLKPV
jgi:glycosyltransferase involved in cell wall biosynthesis